MHLDAIWFRTQVYVHYQQYKKIHFKIVRYDAQGNLGENTSFTHITREHLSYISREWIL
jgi:hypothetical protein